VRPLRARLSSLTPRRSTRAGEAATRPFPAAAMLAMLDDSLRALYGSVGSGSVAYRLVHWAEAEREGVVAVESGGAERLRAAATLVTQARGETVALHVTAASPFLYSLAHDSRSFCSSLLDEPA